MLSGVRFDRSMAHQLANEEDQTDGWVVSEVADVGGYWHQMVNRCDCSSLVIGGWWYAASAAAVP